LAGGGSDGDADKVREEALKDERSSYEGEPAAGGWSGSGWFAAEQHVEARIGTEGDRIATL